MGIYLWLWDENYWAMRGPCSVGFHIPLVTELQWFISVLTTLWITTQEDVETKLHLPPMGERLASNASVDFRNRCYYWSSSKYTSSTSTSYPGAASAFVADYRWVSTLLIPPRATWYPIRWFKDTYVTPTSSRTVVQWTLWGAWVFRNQTDWLISITDWTTGYTIQDKNLWATTVYNYWNTLTTANMWNMYQWWNNYWFPPTWNVSTSSTKVDASNYWPDNYYSSSTFITVTDDTQDWSSVHNDNLWWWVTWVTRFPLPVKHIYIGEDAANI